MATEIITREDLEAFGERLLNQMKVLLTGGSAESEPRKWIKSYQVKNLLKISSNTLQTLRDNGTIPFTKIGGILYYEMDAIQKVLRGEAQSKRIRLAR
ncbi:helix-turn-helix domain-containing protein [Mucilaginibacter koreensis]